MKKYTWILGGLMAMAITACTSDELMQSPEQQPAEGKVVSVTAYAPGSNPGSRVDYVVGTNGNLYDLTWSQEDQFSVVLNTSHKPFNKESNKANTFTGILPGNSETYYAVYPALSENISITTDNTVPFDLSTQSGKLEGSKPYMRATSTDKGQTFSFSHCTAILKVIFFKKNDGIISKADITKVQVTTPTNYKVNGTINLSNGKLVGTNGNSITITIPPTDDETEDDDELLQQTTVTEEGEMDNSFYIYLPPLDAGNKKLQFEVTVKEGNEEKLYIGTLNGNTEQHMVAGYLYTASVTLEPDNRTFLSLTNNTGSEQTFKLKRLKKEIYTPTGVETISDSEKTNASLEYSLNSSSWENWTDDVEVPADGILRLRGMNPKGTAERVYQNLYDYYDYLNISILSPEPRSMDNVSQGITCQGDIRALIDWRNYENMNSLGTDVRFCYLFENLTELTSISEGLLPATKLSEYCYAGMFSGTGITAIPANLLPATQVGNTSNLGNYCYQYMFKNCTQLTSIPKILLPATRLSESCYAYMFSGCTNLTSIPKELLPATDLSDYCYQGMFSGTGITYIPESLLPANGYLSTGCYSMMFYNCQKLGTDDTHKAIPANLLPSVALGGSCYSQMFRGCINLEEVPDDLLPFSENYGLGASCYSYMFEGCTSLTKVPNLPATQLSTSCYSYMFQGCTSLTEAPDLPATTLAESCYYSMFSDCTSLTIAPTLPATTLVNRCYSFMFYNCSALKQVTMLATDITADECLKSWLYNVADIGTITKSVKSTMESGSSGIPSGWNVKVVVQPTVLPSIDNDGEFDDTK